MKSPTPNHIFLYLSPPILSSTHSMVHNYNPSLLNTHNHLSSPSLPPVKTPVLVKYSYLHSLCLGTISWMLPEINHITKLTDFIIYSWHKPQFGTCQWMPDNPTKAALVSLRVHHNYYFLSIPQTYFILSLPPNSQLLLYPTNKNILF